MDIGGLFKSACGAVAKVAKAVVNTVSNAVNSVISGVSKLFNAASAALETAVSNANDMVKKLDFDGDGDPFDLVEDVGEIIYDELKLLVGAVVSVDLESNEGILDQWGENWRRLKASDEGGQIIKETGTFKWGVKQTQEETFPEFFDTFGFDIDENGVYHSQQDGWQKYLGYTNLYDEGFDLGCSMGAQKFPFSIGDEEYIIWLWKGDYLNLGAGAETGIYKGGEPFWTCDTSDSMPMTLKLKDSNGNVIYDWNPEHNNWWCTGFNPQYQNQDVSNLISEGTIDFSEHLDLWNAFKNTWKNESDFWEFDEENHIAKYTWKGTNLD